MPRQDDTARTAHIPSSPPLPFDPFPAVAVAVAVVVAVAVAVNLALALALALVPAKR